MAGWRRISSDDTFQIGKVGLAQLGFAPALAAFGFPQKKRCIIVHRVYILSYLYLINMNPFKGYTKGMKKNSCQAALLQYPSIVVSSILLCHLACRHQYCLRVVRIDGSDLSFDVQALASFSMSGIGRLMSFDMAVWTRRLGFGDVVCEGGDGSLMGCTRC